MRQYILIYIAVFLSVGCLEQTDTSSPLDALSQNLESCFSEEELHDFANTEEIEAVQEILYSDKYENYTCISKVIHDSEIGRYFQKYEANTKIEIEMYSLVHLHRVRNGKELLIQEFDNRDHDKLDSASNNKQDVTNGQER